MIQFFRKIRRNLLSNGNTGKYIQYAIGEIILVVLGILIALQINNWNEAQKEERLKLQLINLLISDLEEKKKENKNDSEYAQIIIKRAQSTINNWETKKNIDTTNLRWNLRALGADTFFQNDISPVYNGFSNADLWKQIPDSLTKQIDDIYRIRLMRVRKVFEKASEYGTYCKLNFLTPNNLMDLNRNIEDIHDDIVKVSDEYTHYLKLIINSSNHIDSNLESSATGIEKLIDDLNYYKNDFE